MSIPSPVFPAASPVPERSRSPAPPSRSMSSRPSPAISRTPERSPRRLASTSSAAPSTGAIVDSGIIAATHGILIDGTSKIDEGRWQCYLDHRKEFLRRHIERGPPVSGGGHRHLSLRRRHHLFRRHHQCRHDFGERLRHPELPGAEFFRRHQQCRHHLRRHRRHRRL